MMVGATSSLNCLIVNFSFVIVFLVMVVLSAVEWIVLA